MTNHLGDGCPLCVQHGDGHKEIKKMKHIRVGRSLVDLCLILKSYAITDSAFTISASKNALPH